jgi:hypothetical protein
MKMTDDTCDGCRVKDERIDKMNREMAKLRDENQKLRAKIRSKK